MDRNNQATLWGWFLGGAALGGVVALLLAPKTGAKTRELIAEGLSEDGSRCFRRVRKFSRGVASCSSADGKLPKRPPSSSRRAAALQRKGSRIVSSGRFI